MSSPSAGLFTPGVPSWMQATGSQNAALDAGLAAQHEGSNWRFTETLGQQARLEKNRLDMQYKVAKLQAASESERMAVDRWYKEQQVALAEKTFDENVRQFNQKFGLSEGELTGWYQNRPTLAREQFGLDVLKTAAEMRSRPDMLFQYGEFARNLPALLGGNQTRGGVQPSGSFGTAPEGQTLAGQAAELGYLSFAQAPGQPSNAQAMGADPVLGAIGKTYAQGFDKLGAQTLEGMDKNELGFLQSGGGYLGYDYDRALREYAGSRLGQSVGGR